MKKDRKEVFKEGGRYGAEGELRSRLKPSIGRIAKKHWLKEHSKVNSRAENVGRSERSGVGRLRR